MLSELSDAEVRAGIEGHGIEAVDDHATNVNRPRPRDGLRTPSPHQLHHNMCTRSRKRKTEGKKRNVFQEMEFDRTIGVDNRGQPRTRGHDPMFAPGLRVVRFAGAGLREWHELAFCVPLPCSTVRVIYSDREVICTAPELATALEVNLNALLSKAHVLAAVQCGFEAIRAKLPCHEDSAMGPPWVEVGRCKQNSTLIGASFWILRRGLHGASSG